MENVKQRTGLYGGEEVTVEKNGHEWIVVDSTDHAYIGEKLKQSEADGIFLKGKTGYRGSIDSKAVCFARQGMAALSPPKRGGSIRITGGSTRRVRHSAPRSRRKCPAHCPR